MSLPTRPELLAPAGDWDALRAAVANGADAVYFGLSQFNARHRATNFTLEQLPEKATFFLTPDEPRRTNRRRDYSLAGTAILR